MAGDKSVESPGREGGRRVGHPKVDLRCLERERWVCLLARACRLPVAPASTPRCRSVRITVLARGDTRFQDPGPADAHSGRYGAV